MRPFEMSGMTRLIIEHLMDALMSVSERVPVMDQGAPSSAAKRPNRSHQ